jgi:hypothetical protein
MVPLDNAEWRKEYSQVDLYNVMHLVRKDEHEEVYYLNLFPLFNMLSHSHPDRLCMEPCWMCGGNLTSHTETDAETQCFPKKLTPSQAVLWHPAKCHTHIKRENSCDA